MEQPSHASLAVGGLKEMKKGGVHKTGRSYRGPQPGVKGGMKYSPPETGNLEQLRLILKEQQARRDEVRAKGIGVYLSRSIVKPIYRFMPEICNMGELEALTNGFSLADLQEIPGIGEAYSQFIRDQAKELGLDTGLDDIAQSVRDQAKSA